jgi:branched-chain amino acid transport system ATP-binding protein
MDLVFSFANRMTVLVNGTVLTRVTRHHRQRPAGQAVYLGHGEEMAHG